MSLSCYHHLGRNAVATCSTCGKGLCEECADVLETTDHKLYCVDCYKRELATNVVKIKKARSKVIRELVFIGIGLTVGFILAPFLMAMFADGTGNAPWFLWIIIPCVFASLGSIVGRVIAAPVGWILKILYFLLLCLISPVVFIWRTIVRIVDIVKLTKIARNDSEGVLLADEFFRAARNPASSVDVTSEVGGSGDNSPGIDIQQVIQNFGRTVRVSATGSADLDAIMRH